MPDRLNLESGGTLKSVLHYYKNQKMCNESVHNYLHILEFVPECYNAQKRCDKTVNTFCNKISS